MSRSVYPPRSSWSAPAAKPVKPKPKPKTAAILKRGTRTVSTISLIITTGVLITILVLTPQKKPITFYRKPTAAVHHAAKKPVVVAVPTSTTLPALNDGAPCANGTVITTVAHEDDDILFMNPDVSNEIAAGKCMRTVFITAGDAGRGQDYWQSREQGALAAYAAMYNTADDWTQGRATINGKDITCYGLVGQPRVSLVFLRLPDGNVGGEGFASTHNESLNQIRNRTLTTITAVDNSASYTESQLVSAIGALIRFDNPQTINTQAFGPILSAADHSDHQAVGYFTALAQQLYGPTIPIIRYVGYQSNGMAPNLTAEQSTAKLAIFSAYEKHDDFICDQTDDCPGEQTYQNYILREYHQTRPIGNLETTTKQ